jgi:Fe-S cluster assembly ATP-binding protein
VKSLDGEDLRELAPEESKGVFFRFSTCRNSGVSVTNFIRTAINETRKANGQEEMPANEMLKVIVRNQNYFDRKFLRSL